MKKYFLTALTIFAFMGCKSTDNLTMLVGTYTDTDSKGIYTYSFNQATGEASPLAVADTKNPSFLAVTPDNKTVYSVSELDEGSAVSCFDFDAATGVLTFRNAQPTKARGACHVNFIGKDVVSSNYSSGTMTVFPLDASGKLEEGSLFEFRGRGPNRERQERSHIHSSQLSPDGKYLFVIDLGCDFIYRYPVKDGKVASFEPVKIKTPAGSGPRHFAFSKDARFMYVVTELEGTVLVYDYNGGDLKQIQVIVADPLHAAGSADIHFSPDGKFLYASNRLEGDGIMIFSQDAKTGLLTEVGYQLTGIHPRNFCITPNGKYVLVACRDTNSVQVFERDPKTGLLTDTHKDLSIPHPVCVLTVPAE